VRHIRRLAGVLAGLAGVLLAFGATPAFASVPHPDPGGVPGDPALVFPAPARITLVTGGGMPGWQITLIAIGSATAAMRSPQPPEPCPADKRRSAVGNGPASLARRRQLPFHAGVVTAVRLQSLFLWDVLCAFGLSCEQSRVVIIRAAAECETSRR
jgi:hypothetical protein